MTLGTARTAHDAIIEWVEPGSSVLELGCGHGELLWRLVREKNVKAQGIEIDDGSISPCIAKGLNVLHEEVDAALHDYADRAFDYTIFDESLQRVVRQPDPVLGQALRVSRKAIIGFSNFAHYRARGQILLGGRTPVTSSLPYTWYETPNLHFLSILDFRNYCDTRDIYIEKTAFFGKTREMKFLPNLTALTGFFLVSKRPPVREDRGPVQRSVGSTTRRRDPQEEFDPGNPGW